MLYEE
jgi:hypothetical protein